MRSARSSAMTSHATGVPPPLADGIQHGEVCQCVDYPLSDHIILDWHRRERLVRPLSLANRTSVGSIAVAVAPVI